MFCKNCGNPIQEGERFCSKCGTPVEDSSNNQTNHTNFTNNNSSTEPYSDLNNTGNVNINNEFAGINDIKNSNINNDFGQNINAQQVNSNFNGQYNFQNNQSNGQYNNSQFNPQYNPQYNPNLNNQGKSNTGKVIAIVLITIFTIILLIVGSIIGLVVHIYKTAENAVYDASTTYNITNTVASRSTYGNTTYSRSSIPTQNVTLSNDSSSTDYLQCSSSDLSIRYDVASNYEEVEDDRVDDYRSYKGKTSNNSSTEVYLELDEMDRDTFDAYISSIMWVDIKNVSNVTISGKTYKKYDYDSSEFEDLLNNPYYDTNDFYDLANISMDLYVYQIDSEHYYLIEIYNESTDPADYGAFFNIKY